MRLSALFAIVALAGCTASKQDLGLKDAVGDKFLIGTALNVWQVAGQDTNALNVVKKHFNAIVAENCMKNGEIHPEENTYNFKDADAFVDFGEKNNMTVTGHCLIWHSQLGPWFCVDEDGKNVSPEVLKERMKSHIYTVVKRYKGRIKGWDVVNEAIEDNGSYRNSQFYQILGEEFIPLAFQYAHEADPDAELYYNDYNMHIKAKRDKVVELVKNLKARGLRIDAVGMQGHMGIDYPKYEEFEESIVSFGKTGAKVMITEWDMSALPTVHMGANVSDRVNSKEGMNPYKNELPDSVSKIWNDRMSKFFKMFESHSDIISRVTAWGVTDAGSWKNDFPVPGRTDYPLLFDRKYQPKQFIKDMLNQE